MAVLRSQEPVPAKGMLVATHHLLVNPPLRKLSKVMSKSSPNIMDPQIYHFCSVGLWGCSNLAHWPYHESSSQNCWKKVAASRRYFSVEVLTFYCHSVILSKRTVLTLLSKGVVVWKRLVGLPACQWILLRADVESNVFQAPLWHPILSPSFDLKIQPRIFKISSQKCSFPQDFLEKNAPWICEGPSAYP